MMLCTACGNLAEPINLHGSDRTIRQLRCTSTDCGAMTVFHDFPASAAPKKAASCSDDVSVHVTAAAPSVGVAAFSGSRLIRSS